MAAYVQLGVLFVQLAFLAVVLGAVGFGVRKVIYAFLESRQESKMRAEAVVMAARARASARAKAR